MWVQEGANTALPIGGILVAIMLACFAYSTCIAYYYEGEAGLAYLFRNKSAEFRNKLIWIIRHRDAYFLRAVVCGPRRHRDGPSARLCSV